MRHNDDAFATILLMSQITPKREELARPLSTSEYYELRALVRENGMTLGHLIEMDMSGMSMRMGLNDQEAYRLCVLLNRTFPLSVSIEGFYASGIDIMTLDDSGYPVNLRERLSLKAPPMFYFAGRHELFRQPAVAILGGLPLKGNAEAETRAFVREATDGGFTIVTDGANGFGRIAEDEAYLCGGRAIVILAGALAERAFEPRMAEMLKERRALLMSPVHPEALYTQAHALQRNKCVFALPSAAVVFAAEEGKGTWEGALEALRNRYADFLYAWDNPAYPANRALINRGATPYLGDAKSSFPLMARAWLFAAAEQLSLFDIAPPRPW